MRRLLWLWVLVLFFLPHANLSASSSVVSAPSSAPPKVSAPVSSPPAKISATDAPHFFAEEMKLIKTETALLESPKAIPYTTAALFNRPEKCPLVSQTHQVLLDKMLSVKEGFKNGKCENKHDALVAELTAMTGCLQTTTHRWANRGPDGKPLPDDAEVWREDATVDLSTVSQMLKARTLVDALAKATEDSECVNGIKDQGLIPAVADLASNLGQMSLMVPSPAGLVVGAGGVTLGATIRIMSKLLEANFDWGLEKDVQQFVALNCSFFDLRRDLEAEDFLSLASTTSQEKIDNGTKLKKDLRAGLFRLKKLQEKIEASAVAKENVLVASSSLLHINGVIPPLQKVAAGLKSYNKDAPTGEMKLKVALLLIGEMPKINLHLEALTKDLDLPFLPHYLRVLTQFTVADLPAFINLKEADFTSRFVVPLELYTSACLDKLKDLHRREHRQLVVQDTTQNYKNFSKNKKEVIKLGSEAIAAFEAGLQKTEQRLQILQKRNDGTTLAHNDEGARIRFELHRSYEQIKKHLYGKQGWSFVSFLLDETKKQQKAFDEHYKAWKKNYFVGSGTLLKPDVSKTWVCRDANASRLIWETMKSALELNYDFFNTNRGLLNTHIRSFRMLMHFMPVNRSFEYRFLKNAEALEMAEAIHAGPSTKTRKDVYKLMPWPHENLGIQYLDFYEGKHKRQELENFIEENQCLQFL